MGQRRHHIVSGDAGNDTIRGEAAHANTLSGGKGNDTIWATLTENYTSYSWTPRNDLDGGDGGSSGLGVGEIWDLWDDGDPPLLLMNRLVGGNGNDTMWVSGTFLGNPPLDSYGSVRNEMLGGAGNDTIYAEVGEGSPGANRMFGHDGNDRLQSVGGDGNLLHGGKGRDVLIGGEGGDTFTGDADADTFVFGSGPGGRDVITDFMADDRIAVAGLVDRGARGLYDDFVAAVERDTGPRRRAGRARLRRRRPDRDHGGRDRRRHRLDRRLHRRGAGRVGGRTGLTAAGQRHAFQPPLACRQRSRGRS